MESVKVYYCESVHTMSRRWHLREADGQRKLSGGVNKPTLCGLTAAWDIQKESSGHRYRAACMWEVFGGISEVEMTTRTLGTCGNCGGPVVVPLIWYGLNPPTPECANCHSIPANPHGRKIPMQPKPQQQSWSGRSKQ